ncbi:unnamed protein product [Eruca vesicaria subsp. sativa]|uniref:Protein ABIL1 n=1 Tax=Eruca vesicaria subsp. sativa TaxID=29727 RepID=A0ABC8M6L0_ERUVS|nr:unnamed protein product [Eruca vesicaria subsp. sativa]
MTFDEVSMERSKSFVKALQELKNLRPQLYSAADYCEKSYLHSEQKQLVLDNLKDYTVKALVNAVDHLGTVASKLTDLFDQQSSDVSTMELRASCVSQPQIPAFTVPQLSEAMAVLHETANNLKVPLEVIAPLDLKKLDGIALGLSGDLQLVNAAKVCVLLGQQSLAYI